MDIRVLKYFVTVANEKNISRAAQKLFVSQPALSKQLKDLEEELGVVLFERGSRNIKLTENGLYLLSQASEIIALTEKTMLNISRNIEEVNGEIFIGAGETRGLTQLMKIIKKILIEYPNIKFHFFSGDMKAILEKLENGTLDFGIILRDLPKDKYNFLKFPHKDKLGILTTKDSSISKLKSIEPKNLANLPIIISNQMLEDSTIENWAGNYYSKINIIASYSLLFNASLMVEENIGHAICLDGIINTKDTNLIFIPLNSSKDTNLNLIWKKNISQSKAVRIFIDYCTKELNKNID